MCLWTVLLAWVLWEFRWLRLPVVILGASIIASTVPTGSHYVIDVIGGLIVSAISIAFAESRNREREAEQVSDMVEA